MKHKDENISFFEKIGYGLGDTASNLFWMTFIYFLPYFYTDVFGISSAAVGTMFLLTRIWDGVNDPIMGLIADRTETRWGKFRPYILWMVLPFAIIGISVFTTPNFSMGGKIIYAYITYTLMGMVYTAINIPYSSLMGVVSSNPLVRTQFSQYRFILAFSGGLIVQAATLPMVNYFGGNENSVIEAQMISDHQIVITEKGEGTSKIAVTAEGIKEKPLEKSISISVLNPTNYAERDTTIKIHYLKTGFGSDTITTAQIFNDIDYTKASKLEMQFVNERMGFQWALTVFAVLCVLMFMTTFFSAKERVKPVVENQSSIKQDLKDLMKNRPWILLFFLGIFTLTHVCIRNGSILYYFKYYVGNQDLSTAFMLAGTIATLAAIPLTGWAARVMGKKNAYIICMSATTILSLGYYLLPPESVTTMFVLQVLINFFFGPTAPLVFAMYTDCADFSEWKTGRRATGLVMSASTMAQKFGWAIGGALTGWILFAFGFVANVEQSTDTLGGILAMMSWVPAIASAFGAALMVFYTLNEKKMKEIEEELYKRRHKELV